jgi:hypothetical protein
VNTPHRRVLSVATVLVSLFLSLLAMEMLVRLLHVAPSLPKQHYVRDPHLPWKPEPLSVTARAGGAGPEFRHNSFGFRDVEHRYEKEGQVFRILGLGDSFTYGALVRFEDTYLYRLETMLNRRPGAHPRVEIIKAGIPRYYPETERMLLESYGAQYSPDLILVGFLPNDVTDTYAGLDDVTVSKAGELITREAAELRVADAWIFRASHLLRLALKEYIDYRRAKRYQPRFADVYRENGFHEKDWRTVESEYGKMAAIASRLHSELVIVHIPHQGPWMHSYPGKRLAAWASRNGVGFVDVLPGMVRAAGAGQRLYYEKDGHCRPAGYAVIAAEIYEYLTKNELVP